MKDGELFNPATATQRIYDLTSEAKRRFEENERMVGYYDKELTDLNHLIELAPFNAKEGYKLIKLVKANRLNRRKCKDENIMLKPLYDFLTYNNANQLKAIGGVNKDTKKAIEIAANQEYHPRTSIIPTESFPKRVK